MPSPVRVLICGGRDFSDMRAMSVEMGKVRDWYGGISCVIQGGARGADNLGRLWAEREGLPVIEMRANWDRFGKGAGPVRNAWMIEHGKPDVVVAFPGGRGTENMLALAAKAELIIWTPLASRIEAATADKTAQTGLAVGESATVEGGDAQHQSPSTSGAA